MTLILLNVAGYPGRELDQLLDSLRAQLDVDVQATMDIDEHNFDPAIASLAVESLSLIIAGLALRLQWQDRRSKPGAAAGEPEPTPPTEPQELSEPERHTVEQLTSALAHTDRATTTVSGYRLSVSIRREVVTIQGIVEASPTDPAPQAPAAPADSA